VPPGVNEPISSVKVPVPVPFVIWVTLASPIVGVASVMEQTNPLEVVAPPSATILPFNVPDVVVTSEASSVVTVGATPDASSVIVIDTGQLPPSQFAVMSYHCAAPGLLASNGHW
jgi:hypothetical protein